ncbi:MAG: hypothetical protein MUF18_10420 [Fimbriiglobus sp.]|nr:hypothetical protein [Fimbriiglobus sp.]
MDQLYCTGPASGSTTTETTPPPGKSLRLPTVRATSAGVRPEALHAVLPHSLFTPTPTRPSARLALLKTPQGRLLTHAVPHDGGFFAHTLLNVPDTADALLAVQTWGSPQWQRTPPEGGSELPELPYLPVADVLDDAGLKEWLSDSYHRELLEFALTALLGGPAESQLFLAAASNDVAWVVYAAGRALPPDFVESLTFSTAEAEPLTCTARVVGYDPGPDGPDLPAACYRPHIGLNTFTSKRTDLKAAVPFAPFAVNALAEGNFAQLDDLKATWQRLGVKSAAKFDLVFRLDRGTGTLTKDEATDALLHPPLAAWISARADVLQQLLEWAIDDRTFANGPFGRAVQSLRQKPDVLAKLAASVRTAGDEALAVGDRNRTANAFEVILPMVAPAKANAVWGELLTRTPDPDSLAWEMRWYLLPRFVRFKQQNQPTASADPAFARWLDVPADRLSELLALDLPKAYQLTAATAAVRREAEPSPLLVTTLAKHPALVLELLKADDGGKLFAGLLAHAPERGWFEDVVGNAADYPPAQLNAFFEATLAAGKLDADRLVRTQGNRLLELFAGQSGLDRLGTQFLATPPADSYSNAAVLGFLAKLREQDGLTDDLKGRIDAVRTVRAYLDSPTFDTAAIAPVRAAFALTPPVLPPAAKDDLFNTLVRELADRLDAASLQDDLIAALNGFGDTAARDGTDLFENLLREVRKERPEFGRKANAVEAFLAVALGAADDRLVPNPEGLDGHAFAVASDAAKLGGAKVLAEVDRRAADWPKNARTKWGFLLTAVRPKVRWQRDLICAAIGGAVVAALMVASKFMQ